MVAVPGSTSAETIAAIIADEMAIGVMSNKTTAVRINPVPGREASEMVEFGRLLGSAPLTRECQKPARKQRQVTKRAMLAAGKSLKNELTLAPQQEGRDGTRSPGID